MSKDYEFLTATSETWIYLSIVRLMLKRLPTSTSSQPPTTARWRELSWSAFAYSL
jgi:hypothetical protein